MRIVTLVFLLASLVGRCALADAKYPLPWVAGVTRDSVHVGLAVTTTTNATVEFGTSPTFGMTAMTENHQATDVVDSSVHNVKLTGLQLNTQYHDRVTQNVRVTSSYSFWTALQPGTRVRWGFGADSRAGGNTVHNTWPV
ncbi:MAG: hypothetical protein FJ284_03585 [Planctomycetes bacterium]|nr:hypothetical protein [Planctomycetota bacterium]MBM4057096.1 hypothetical protein [Planctomycetota bacterium]